MSTAPGTPKAGRVPASGEAIVEFVNTRPFAGYGERLDDPGHGPAVLRRFAPAVTEVPAALLDDLRAVRADLAAIAAREPGEDARWRDFTERTAGVALQRDFTVPGEVRLRQVAGDPVLGGIAAAVADLVTAGAWARVRICDYEPCSAAFYDTTRSRTQRWHSYEVCGNRANVAAHRARRARGG